MAKCDTDHQQSVKVIITPTDRFDYRSDSDVIIDEPRPSSLPNVIIALTIIDHHTLTNDVTQTNVSITLTIVKLTIV